MLVDFVVVGMEGWGFTELGEESRLVGGSEEAIWRGGGVGAVGENGGG